MPGNARRSLWWAKLELRRGPVHMSARLADNNPAWPVWAVVAFPLQPADEADRIGPTAIGQLAQGVVVRSFFTQKIPSKILLRLRIFASS